MTKSPTDSSGAEAELGILRQGNSFGELSTIDGLPRSANVTAMGPVTCYFLPRDDFMIALAFAQLVLEGRVDRQIRHMAHHCVRRQATAAVMSFRGWTDATERRVVLHRCREYLRPYDDAAEQCRRRRPDQKVHFKN